MKKLNADTDIIFLEGERSSVKSELEYQSLACMLMQQDMNSDIASIILKAYH